MRTRLLLALLLLLALVLSGCRFAVVETGTVRVETPTEAPSAGEGAS